MRLYARWLATAVPCRQRAAQSSLWSHNRGVTAATVGRGRSRGCRLSHAYQRGPPSYLGWRKDTYSIVFRVHLAPNASMLACSRRPYHAVNEQHSRRCGVITVVRPLPRWTAVAQGGVALRMHIREGHPLALVGAKILIVSSL